MNYRYKRILTLIALRILLASMGLCGASQVCAMNWMSWSRSRGNIRTFVPIGPKIMNVAGIFATTGMAWSWFQGNNNKSVVCCSICAIVARYIAYNLTKLSKSPKPKLRRGGSYCYANIEDSLEKIYEMPKRLEDEEWKQLFNLMTTSYNVSNKLTTPRRTTTKTTD